MLQSLIPFIAANRWHAFNDRPFESVPNQPACHRGDGTMKMMNLDELYHRPGHLLRRANQIIIGMFVEEIGDLNITPVQFASMVVIAEHPKIDATRLSELVALDRSTVGNVIERLEDKGLVSRTPSRDDKRVKLIQLSRKGEEALTLCTPAVERSQERFLASLKPADRANFMRLLAALVHLNNEHSRAPLRLSDDVA